MTDYSELVNEGRVRRGRFSQKQVRQCVKIARRDLDTAKALVETSPE